jgi:hypothetical protein
MHSSSSSSSSSSHVYSRQHQQHEQADCDRSGSAAAAGATTPVSSSGSNLLSFSKEPLDPATAAAAAALGAEADRLLKALNLRMEQHHPKRSRKQQRHKGIKVHRPAGIEDGLVFEDGAEEAAINGDEPICIPVEYLRL